MIRIALAALLTVLISTGSLEARARRHGRAASVSSSCLVPAARDLLARIEAQFGKVTLISTCRPGAVIAGTNHPSLHRYGKAFDFTAPDKRAVVAWLIANNRGGTMTYSDMSHIHADVGPHFVALGANSHTHAVKRKRAVHRRWRRR